MDKKRALMVVRALENDIFKIKTIIANMTRILFTSQTLK